MALQTTNQDLPLTFRSDIVDQVMQAVSAGESCAIVGIGSVGKSNLLRFLRREDVRQTYLGEHRPEFLFVYVDINKILKLSRWGLFELMLHQLLIELTDRATDQTILTTLDDLHQRATQPQTRYLALRHLDRAIRVICNQLGLRLVFLIDEFDDLCRRMVPEGFSALRALRDDYKYQLMYVVTTRLGVKRLRDEPREIESFEELVSPRTFWLGPYSEEDARVMLHRLATRHEATLNEKSVAEILEVTGGHPGLLREGYNVARQQSRGLVKALAKRLPVRDECQRIWLSLSPQEQRAMITLSGTGRVAEDQTDVVTRLRAKGLVRGPSLEKNQIFSPLFKDYIKKQNPVVGAGIIVDRNSSIVSVHGHEIKGLTPLEYKLIEYMDRNRSHLCTYDDLAAHLYPDDMSLDGGGVTDTRLHSLVKRLRKQIEPNPKEPRYILTVRGRGLRLVDGQETED